MAPFRSFAATIATASISLAAFGAATAEFLQVDSGTHQVDQTAAQTAQLAQTTELGAIISLAALFLIFTSALCLDWVMDSITDEEIEKLAAVFHDAPRLERMLRNPTHCSFWSRTAMFAGGYLMISLAYGAFAFLLGKSAILLAAKDISSSHAINSTHTVIAYLAGTVFGSVIFIKMMTQTLSRNILVPFAISVTTIVGALVWVIVT